MINFDLNDCDENDLTRKSDLPFGINIWNPLNEQKKKLFLFC